MVFLIKHTGEVPCWEPASPDFEGELLGSMFVGKNNDCSSAGAVAGRAAGGGKVLVSGGIVPFEVNSSSRLQEDC